MLANIGIGSFGIVCLGVAIWMWCKSFSRRAVAVLMLLAGLTLTGALASLLTKVAAKIQSTLTSTGAQMLGVAVSGVVFLIGLLVTLEVFLGLVGRGKRAKRGGGGGGRGGQGDGGWFLPVLSLLAPALLLAGGGFFGDAVGELIGALKSTVGA